MLVNSCIYLWMWTRDLGYGFNISHSIPNILYKVGNSCILWISKLKPIEYLSTSKVEYIVLNNVGKEML